MKSFLSRSAPWILVAVLSASYASLILGVPAVAASFADFVIEMPAPTLWASKLASFGNVRTMPLVFVMAGIPFILGKHRQWTWRIGFVSTLIFSFSLLASMLPFLTILDALRDSDEPQNLLAPLPQIMMATFVVFLPPLLFLALRRAFLGTRASQNQRLRD